ncbi:MAG TPA: hypothetical protein VKF59_16125 [Candidatus Dormibacteraeota bacterium]|nr:hypothetical protein [Candidatus Dormibacteraeota bacterium]
MNIPFPVSRAAPPPLGEVLDVLEDVYGPQPPPAVTDPWQQVVLENVVYLVDDERRLRAFERLGAVVGTAPEQVLAAAPGALQEATGLGMRPDAQADKLRAAARLALDQFGGDLSAIRALPLAEARRALRRFPAIGEPAADRILLFAGIHPVVALDSNGVRVLLRLGFGEERPGYAATLRSVRGVVGPELAGEFRPLVRAYLLLRAHGRGLCRRSSPACAACPLAERCAHALAAG